MLKIKFKIRLKSPLGKKRLREWKLDNDPFKNTEDQSWGED